MQNIKRQLRACLKIAWGPAARDFGGGQGGEAGASPQRAVTAEPTPANAKRSAARRVFAEKARWLRCSSVTGPGWPCSLVTPRHRAFSAKTGPHGIFRQALSPSGAGSCPLLLLELGFPRPTGVRRLRAERVQALEVKVGRAIARFELQHAGETHLRKLEVAAFVISQGLGKSVAPGARRLGGLRPADEFMRFDRLV